METRNDYDVWRCAGCGREVIRASLPHRQPQCCGTGMWWQRFVPGAPYQLDLEIEIARLKDRQRGGMRDA